MKYLSIFSLVLAVMLVLCLAPMPYGYYMLVRVIAMVIFAVMCYKYRQKGEMDLAIILVILCILFQPFFKIPLGKIIWGVVDVATAIMLVGLWMKERRGNE